MLLPLFSNAIWTDNALLQLHHATVTDLNILDCWVCSHVPITATGGLPLSYAEMLDFLFNETFFNRTITRPWKQKDTSLKITGLLHAAKFAFELCSSIKWQDNCKNIDGCPGRCCAVTSCRNRLGDIPVQGLHFHHFGRNTTNAFYNIINDTVDEAYTQPANQGITHKNDSDPVICRIDCLYKYN